ncbi:MAG: OmpA family protein [Thiobacillus sp.]|nr:OmpA family protein [Thiobacillus sp.]
MPLPSAKPLLLPTLVALTLGGCVSKEFVQQEVGVVGKRIDELQAALDKTNQRLEVNTRWLSEADARIGKTEAGQTALNGRLDETAAGLAKASEKIDNVAGGLAATGQRVDANSASIAAAGQQIEANVAAVAAANQRIDGLDGRLNAAAGQAESAQRALAGNTAQIAKLEGEIAAVKASVPTVTALAPIAPSTTAAVAPAPVAAVPTPAAAPAPVVAAAPAPEAAAVTDSRARLEAIAAQIDAATKRIDENTAAIQAASDRMKAVESGLNGAQTGQQAGEAALASANKRIDELQAGLDAARQNSTASADANNATGKRLDNLEMTLAVAINKIETADKQLTAQDGQIKSLDERVSRNEKDISLATATAQEALARANAAGKLAEGKLVYETQLTDETAPFTFHSAVLTDETKQILTALANKLKAANENVYVEIQGHTDNSGPADANQRLALARAEAVRDYLHAEGGLPLHRVAVVSYGETRPLADNKTREGRSKNRRVQIVVLK